MNPSDDTPPPIDALSTDDSVTASLALTVGRLDRGLRTFRSAAEYLTGVSPASPSCLLIDDALLALTERVALDELAVRGRLAPTIVIVDHLDAATADRAGRLGARGFLVKPLAPASVGPMLRDAAMEGERRSFARGRLAVLAAEAQSLSDREVIVLEAISAGKLNKAIARELAVSVRTIESDRSRAVEKLAARTAGEAIAKFSEFRTLAAIEGVALPPTSDPAPKQDSPIDSTASAHTPDAIRY